jgi:hypothetical protein
MWGFSATREWLIYVSSPSLVESRTQPPDDFTLYQAYPNPFNGSTRVAFLLDKTQKIRLQIYDLNGALVKTLVDQVAGAGAHEVVWDGLNSHGSTAPSGIFFVRLETGQGQLTRRLVLVR